MKRLRIVIGVLSIVIVVYGVFLALGRPAREHVFFSAMAQDRPLVIAHRGGADLWPENTLVSFAGAEALGVDVLEMDVYQTADGVPVVIHDETVDRTTNATGPVIDYTLSRLKELDAAHRFSPLDAPGVYPMRGRGIKVPTLREMFETFPDMPMIVEVKEPDTALADAVLALVHEFDRVDRTLLASFYHEILVHFRSADPTVATHASESEVIRLLVASLLFSGGVISPDYEAVLVPPKSGFIPVLTRRFLKAATRRNLFVAAWTINDADQMRVLTDRGTRGLITDRPDLAIGVVREVR